MKIILINSHGPMGSSVVSSIIEHLGFLNIPVRKLGLFDYLSNKIPRNSNHMIRRFEKLIKKHSSSHKIGGVNVLDRNSGVFNQFIDKESIFEKLNALKKKQVKDPIELYEQLRCSYNNSLLYKSVNNNFTGHIEMTTKIHHHDPIELYKLLKENFSEFYVINLRRDFTSWLNSLFSQWHLNKKNEKKLRLVNIKKLYDDYNNYNNFLNSFPGLEINFDDIFLPNSENTIKKIVKYFGKKNNLNWKELKYDLYGNIVHYHKAFDMRDDNINYLSKKTKKLIREGQKSNFDSIIRMLFIYIGYLYSFISLRFRLNNK